MAGDYSPAILFALNKKKVYESLLIMRFSKKYNESLLFMYFECYNTDKKRIKRSEHNDRARKRH